MQHTPSCKICVFFSTLIGFVFKNRFSLETLRDKKFRDATTWHRIDHYHGTSSAMWYSLPYLVIRLLLGIGTYGSLYSGASSGGPQTACSGNAGPAEGDEDSSSVMKWIFHVFNIAKFVCQKMCLQDKIWSFLLLGFSSE